MNKIIPSDSTLAEAFAPKMVVPKVLVRSAPPSPPHKDHHKHDQRRNPFTQFYKNLKPTVNQSSDTVSIQALKALALSNIDALARSNTLQEQYKFLSDTKLHLAHIAGINADDSDRAQSITSIAQNLSMKFTSECVHPDLHDKVLRLFMRLLAPEELKNSTSSGFNHINDSLSPLVSQETRSLVITNLVQAWPHLDARKKQHVINLTLNQFENKGITSATRETLLNFLVKEALVGQDLSGSPKKYMAREDQTLRVLNVIDSTILEPRNFQQLCKLETNLVEVVRKLELAPHPKNMRSSLPSAVSHPLTLAREILDSVQELQADTLEGKHMGLPARLKFQREQRVRERESTKMYIDSSASMYSSSPSSSDS